MARTGTAGTSASARDPAAIEDEKNAESPGEPLDPAQSDSQISHEKFNSTATNATEDAHLTAFQYPDGRVKIQHPGIGERLRTYYPHEIKRIGGKNDLLKSNAEKAIEGEAQLRPNDEGQIVLSERAGYLATGYSFPTWKKWVALFFTGLIQISMNYNTSCYSNAVPGIVEKFHVSSQAARVGQMIYLVAYSFGCELWAPWSEEFGRKPILQLSLTLVNGAYLTPRLALPKTDVDAVADSLPTTYSLYHSGCTSPELWLNCGGPVFRWPLYGKRRSDPCCRCRSI